jgi:hypothetical protein
VRYRWQAQGEEPLTGLLNLRLPEKLLVELKQIENWQAKARAALAALVEAERPQEELPGQEIAGCAAAMTGGQGHLSQDAADDRRRADQVDGNN